MQLRYRLIANAVLLLLTMNFSMGQDQPTGDFAIVEVQGKLSPRTDTAKGKDIYKVTLGAGKAAQLYHLILPDDDAMRKLAKELEGQNVVVSGPLHIKEVWDFKARGGSRLLVGEIRVRSLKKAGAPK